jgi:hypothetical protein
MGTFSPAATAGNPDAISVCFEVRRPLEENFGLIKSEVRSRQGCRRSQRASGEVAVKSDRVELQEVAEQLDEKTGNEKKQT